MNGLDPNVAYNMPEQQEDFWSKTMGALSGVGEKISERPEMTAIALDMLGKGFDPKSSFAGVGTALGKSQLASKAEAAGQTRSQDMFQQLLSALTPGDKPGPTSFTAALGKEGKGVDYSIKGLEGMETPTRLPGAAETETGIKTVLDESDFMKAFGGGGL